MTKKLISHFVFFKRLILLTAFNFPYGGDFSGSVVDGLNKGQPLRRQSAALGAGGRSLLDFRFYYVALSYLVVKCLHIFLHTLFTEHLTTRIITYEIQGTELYLINVNRFTQFFLIYITSFIYSVLAPSTSSVPLATTEFRIGRRAEILHLCWQLVFDAPVAEFPTLLFTFTHTHYFVYKLHL